jgi:hypothetical protein
MYNQPVRIVFALSIFEFVRVDCTRRIRYCHPLESSLAQIFVTRVIRGNKATRTKQL